MTDRETPAGAVEAPSLTCLDCGEPVHLVHTVRHPNDYRATQHSARVASLTRSVDVERWQWIETAAREHVEVVDRYEKSQGDASMRLIDSTEAALRDALVEGQK